jgi:hypothetical protein
MVDKRREIVLSCLCGRSVLLQLDREAITKTVRCSACGMRGSVADFVTRAQRLPPDALIVLADRPA